MENKVDRCQLLKNKIKILSNVVNVFKRSKSTKISLKEISKKKSQTFNTHPLYMSTQHIPNISSRRRILKVLLADKYFVF